MAVKVDTLREKLIRELGATHLTLEDLSDGCGAKFQAVIVSAQFDGKKLLQRHRLVNNVIAEEMKSIHAFQMKTLTPNEWEKKKTQTS